jgi:hypothetical protein
VIPPSDSEQNCSLHFMAYYFPKYRLEDFGEHETQQNELTREWILKLKRLAINDSTASNNRALQDLIPNHTVSYHEGTKEFKLFSFLLDSAIKKLILNQHSSQQKVGLMAVPGSSPDSRNGVSLLITELCSKNSNFINLSDAMIRKSYCDSTKSTHDEKVNSLSLDLDVLSSFFLHGDRARSIIIVDDVYSSGKTFRSVWEILFTAEEKFKKFFLNLDFNFFSFGKTLSIQQLNENKFSNPLKEIMLPNLSHGPFLENEIKKLRASIPICFLNIYDDPDLFDFSPAKVGILQTVYHPYLGEGNITDYENNSQGPTVYVKFLNSGFKKLLVSHEKLKTKQHGDKSII